MRVIDSHTAGEPTRVILDGGPNLGEGSVKERSEILQNEHQDFCSAVLLEPRGHDAMVGAFLVEPSDKNCVAGVIYFNPAGNLGMCGHATIGLAVTLAHLGKIETGKHLVETPVGVVEIFLESKSRVSVMNVESYRHKSNVQVEVEGLGTITGDVAYGGNWFFLTEDSPTALTFENIQELTIASIKIRDALHVSEITGLNGAEIDHIEFFSSAKSLEANSRNFVLCPGGAYDRSPCGTGCSAKIACLAEDGKWPANETWIQESIIDSIYEVSYVAGDNGGVIPTISGEAFVTSEATLIFEKDDPYANGIKA